MTPSESEEMKELQRAIALAAALRGVAMFGGAFKPGAQPAPCGGFVKARPLLVGETVPEYVVPLSVRK